MTILEVFAGVLLARIAGDALAFAIIKVRQRKRKKNALSALKEWETLLEQREKAAGSQRATAEITD